MIRIGDDVTVFTEDIEDPKAVPGKAAGAFVFWVQVPDEKPNLDHEYLHR